MVTLITSGKEQASGELIDAALAAAVALDPSKSDETANPTKSQEDSANRSK